VDWGSDSQSMAESMALVVSGAVGAGILWYANQRHRLRTSWYAGDGWKLKRGAFSSVHPHEALVITDFDATLTSGDSQQCHDLCGFSEVISEDFRSQFAPLLDWAANPDIDGVEWWDRAHELMVRFGAPKRQLIPRLVREAQMTPRPGALELLKRLEELGIPVLIVSAGLSDVIEEFLRQNGALSENVTVCSNRLNYAADMAPKSVSPSPPITSFTKAYAYSSASSFFEQHASRRSLIVLGDSVTDVDASKNVPFDRSLSVGFLNSRPDGLAHSKAFDAVVLGDQGSLLPVTDLIDEMAEKGQTGRAAGLMRTLSGRSLCLRGGGDAMLPTCGA